MSEQIKAIASRLEALREIMDVSQQEMADTLSVSLEEYQSFEQGGHDFSFSFLYGCANKLGVDIVDLITGDTPKLNTMSLVRKDEGLGIDRRQEYTYQHLAFFFRKKVMEPFLVAVAPGDNDEMHVNSHAGQEFNYILSGSMELIVANQMITLNEGDAVYYDSSQPHGMRAAGEQPCKFLAIIAK